MTERYELNEERHVGIEVDVGDGPVRPIWRVVTIRVPDGVVPADKWDAMTFQEKRTFLTVGEETP